MNTEIQKYEPMLMITLFEGEPLFLPLSLKDQLYTSVKNEKFIEVEDQIVNTNQIKNISPADIQFNLKLVIPDEKIRKIVKMRMKQYQQKLNRPPTEETILRWANEAAEGKTVF